jgi:hypothetical protein
MDQISQTDRATIASYLNYYHCSHFGPNVAFADILQYLPAVFKKISSNLECYLKTLEDGGDIS